jgi:predicted secreted protein
MPGTVGAGRNLLLKKAAAVIGGVRVLSLEINATPIDITDADSDGVITYLGSDVAEQSIKIDVSGVMKDSTFYDIMVNPATSRLLTDLTFTLPNAAATNDVITCNFFITSFKVTGDYKGEATFDASFMSSGTWAGA